jgi:G protein-coupled receptor kinase
MELENIVANTVYLKAREGGPEGSKGRSKKWKKLLTFPHISECIHLATTLKADNYDYIVDQQPIGQALFRQFCVVSKKPYAHYNDFLDEVENYETELEENRVVEAQKITQKYLTKPSDYPYHLDSSESSLTANGKTDSSVSRDKDSGAEPKTAQRNQDPTVKFKVKNSCEDVTSDDSASAGFDSWKEGTDRDLTEATSYPNSKYIAILPDSLVETVREKLDSKSRDLFSRCQEEVKKFLAGDSFKEFRMSMYFHRFLQVRF